MAPQVTQGEQTRYPQCYDHGEAPTIPSLGYMFPQVGPTDPTFTSFHPNLSSVPTFWDPHPQSFISDPQSTSPQLMPNYDTYCINQPPQPELHLPPLGSLDVYHHPAEDGQLATEAFGYTNNTLITEMDETVLHQRHPLRFRTAPYPPCADRQITAQPTVAPYARL